MRKVNIKPTDKGLVRDPITLEPLAPKGESKPVNSYWLKRIREKEVIEIPTKEPKQ